MNIAEILKYCPKGTKLYSTIYGEVEFDSVTSIKSLINIKLISNEIVTLFSEGQYSKRGECILFPSKDQRDWNKFRLPVKRGDIMMEADGTIPFIASGEYYWGTSPKYICGVDGTDHFNIGTHGWTSEFYIPASEEAKKKLFDKMAEAGYKWNADTLELEKVEPKFKEGDVIVDEQGNLCLVSKIKNNNFMIVSAVLYTSGTLMTYDSEAIERYSWVATLASIKDRNRLFSTLVRKGHKYDKEQHKLIKQEFKPFDKVLVRDKDTEPWKADIYLGYDEEDKCYRYKCTRMNYQFCISYEGNEYLLDTTNDIKN